MALKTLALVTTADVKHSLAPGQISIKSHTKGPFISVPNTSCLASNKKLQEMLKGKKKHSL